MIKRTAKSYLKAYESATEFFRSKNCLLVFFFRLDNEKSGPIETFMKANARSFQYVPPINHRASMVEIAVRDGKPHLVTILFPHGEWGLLMPFAELTFNLFHLVLTRQNQPTSEFTDPPMISLHPLAPVGFTAFDVRPSWAPHGYSSYYHEPALDHYRCHSLCVISTKSSQVTDIVFFCQTFSTTWFVIS